MSAYVARNKLSQSEDNCIGEYIAIEIFRPETELSYNDRFRPKAVIQILMVLVIIEVLGDN